jgi:sugar diacid utilization regulator
METCYREAIALTVAQYQRAAQDAKLAQYRAQEDIKNINAITRTREAAEIKFNSDLALLDAKNSAAEKKAREDFERKLKLQASAQSHDAAMASAKIANAEEGSDFMSSYESARN